MQHDRNRSDGSIAGVSALLAASALMVQPANAWQSDAQVKQAIIDESIDSYPGNCPCPYNRASNGSRCGGRSAYSRDGGYSPKCYPGDVSKAEVEAYRGR